MLELNLQHTVKLTTTPLIFIFLVSYFLSTILLVVLLGVNNYPTNNIFRSIKVSIKKNNLDYFWLSIASLVGIPPLSGFVVKLTLSYFIFLKSSIFTLFMFYIIILLNVFFYVQYLKLLKDSELTSIELEDITSFIEKSTEPDEFNRSVFLISCSLLILGFIFFFKDIYFISYLFLI